MKRALVTGGKGFLGSAAAAALAARGYEVFAAGRSDADLSDAADARRLLAESRPRVVVHAAGATRALDWACGWDAHVGTTLNLLDAVQALGLSTRVVIAGSSAEYGAAAGKKPLSEDSPVSPLSAYGASKRCQTLAALSYRDAPILVARVFNSCGPGAPEHLVPGAFARQLAEIGQGRRKPVLEVGNLAASRDFLDVRDIAAALAALADSRAPRGIYNVCSGRGTPIRSLLDRLIELSGLSVEVRQVAGRRQNGDAPCIVGDPSKLSRATGWKPRLTLDDSLSDTLAWCRAHAR